MLLLPISHTYKRFVRSSSVLLSPWDSLDKNTGVGYPALLQGIFPGSNLVLLHSRQIFFFSFRQILYHLSPHGSPRTLEWVVYPFSRGISRSGIEPGSPAMQADSLPAELPGKSSLHPNVKSSRSLFSVTVLRKLSQNQPPPKRTRDCCHFKKTIQCPFFLHMYSMIRVSWTLYKGS